MAEEDSKRQDNYLKRRNKFASLFSHTMTDTMSPESRSGSSPNSPNPSPPRGWPNQPVSTYRSIGPGADLPHFARRSGASSLRLIVRRACSKLIKTWRTRLCERLNSTASAEIEAPPLCAASIRAFRAALDGSLILSSYQRALRSALDQTPAAKCDHSRGLVSPLLAKTSMNFSAMSRS